jgi:hypothetical protein
MNKWLIEYANAVPVPVYAPAKPGWYTTNPWDAKCFDTKGEAEAWMKEPYGMAGSVPFSAPWEPREHGFDMGSPEAVLPTLSLPNVTIKWDKQENWRSALIFPTNQ